VDAQAAVHQQMMLSAKLASVPRGHPGGGRVVRRRAPTLLRDPVVAQALESRRCAAGADAKSAATRDVVDAVHDAKRRDFESRIGAATGFVGLVSRRRVSSETSLFVGLMLAVPEDRGTILTQLSESEVKVQLQCLQYGTFRVVLGLTRYSLVHSAF